MNQDANATERRKFQFSLRTFMIFVGLVAAGSSFAGYLVARAMAREELTRLGVEHLSVADRPIGGIRYYGICMTGPRIDDNTLSRIVQLIPTAGYNTEVVVLVDANVTSHGLSALRSLRGMERVTLFDCQKVDAEEARRILAGYEVEIGSLRP